MWMRIQCYICGNIRQRAVVEDKKMSGHPDTTRLLQVWTGALRYSSTRV